MGGGVEEGQAKKTVPFFLFFQLRGPKGIFGILKNKGEKLAGIHPTWPEVLN